MTWHENIEDFGEEIGPGSTFRFECHSGLSCLGRCCATEIALTPYDIARMRTHLDTDTHRFLAAYCVTRVDFLTGFPSVFLKHMQDGTCIFLRTHGCDIYQSRPSCCRSYPLARVVEDDPVTGTRLTRYYLQQSADYCEGMGRGPELTIEDCRRKNGLGPYEKAHDIFLEIPFAFQRLPLGLRHHKEVQSMIYQAVFDFDRFFEEHGRFAPSQARADDNELIALIASITVNLIKRTATVRLEEEQQERGKG